MKGNVFQCHGENPDKGQFAKTVGVLEEHINKTFKYPEDIAPMCKTFAIKDVEKPEDLTNDEGKSASMVFVWNEEMKNYLKRRNALQSNKRAVYAIVWGQCSLQMQSKIEALDDYEGKRDQCDCLWLLKEIRGVAHQFEGTRNIFISVHLAWERYYNFKQGPQQTLHSYFKDFQGIVEVLEHYGAGIGAAGPYQKAVREEVKAANLNASKADVDRRVTLLAKNKSVAIAFLKGADKARYGGLWVDLENVYARGNDEYPNDLTGAHNLLVHYKVAPTSHRTGHYATRQQREPICQR